MIKSKTQRALMVLAGSALLAPAALQAQEELEEIFVTGSRIAKDEFSSPAPISVFSEQDFVNSGVVTVDEFLKDVPAFTGFQYGTSTNNGNIGLKAVSLRGLGAKRTLVLINGRRQVGAFVGGNDEVGAVDLNTIPHAMIERVEVLKDGASTIYGSDALGGVVNIILKDDYEGAEFQANYGAGLSDLDAENYGFSALLGATSDRGRITIAAEYNNQDEMLQADRSWAFFDLHPLRNAQGQFIATPSGSSNSRRIRSTSFNAAGDAQLIAAGLMPGDQFIVDEGTGVVRQFAGAADTYNYSPVNALITPNERRQVTGLGEFDLTDTMRVFVEGSYTRRTSQQRLAPDASFAVNPSFPTPNNGFQWNDFVPASNPSNPFGDTPNNPFGVSGQDVRINRRFEESGGRLFNQSVDNLRLVAGLAGEFENGMAWEVAYTYAEGEDTETTSNYGRFDRWATLVDPAACGADPACVAATNGVGYLDPFGPFGTIPQSVFGYLFAGNLKDVRRNDLESFTANLTGELASVEFGGGVLGWSVGVEKRTESARLIPDEFSAGGLTTSGSNNPLSGTVDVEELYGEVYLPFTEKLTVDASIRHSNYDTSAGSTTNYRVGANFAATDSLSFRGTYSTGFRAPNVVELFGGAQTDFPLLDDPCEFFDERPDPNGNLAANCTADGFTPGFEWGFQWQAAYTLQAPTTPLEPEESTTFSVGAVWEPADLIDGLAVSADYWAIEVDEYIDGIPYNDLLFNCQYSADRLNEPACGFFLAGLGHDGIFPDDAVGEINNLGKVETSGIDVNVSYDRGIGLWRFDTLTATLATTYLLDYEETFPVIGTRDRVGTIELEAAFPEWKVNTALTLGARNWSVTWGTRYYSAMDDYLRPANLTDDAEAESIWYQDVYANFDIGEFFTLTVGIDNFTDEDPPRYHSAFNAETEPGTYDVIGRRFFTNFTARF